MAVNATEEITIWIPTIIQGQDLAATSVWSLPLHSTVIAQHIDDPDILGSMQKAFSNFIDSGQVWALLIGVVIGYMLRGLTSYG